MNQLSSIYVGLSHVLSFGQVTRYTQLAAQACAPATKLAIVGGGSGEVLKYVRHVNPNAHIHFYEISASMLKRAKRFADEKTRFMLQDHGLSDEAYDFVLIPFVLNCLSMQEIQSLLTSYHKNMRPQARLIILDFNPNCRSFALGIYLRLLYRAFRLLVRMNTSSLNDFIRLAEASGFQLDKSCNSDTSWYHLGFYSKKAD